MNENKRFTQKDEDDWEILDRNKHFAYAHSGYQAEKIIQELNELVETNRELYKENKELKEENEQLKKELEKFKEWEKHIGDVKREDLDKVFKMSIYEIAEAFEYYRKRIKELQE